MVSITGKELLIMIMSNFEYIGGQYEG